MHINKKKNHMGIFWLWLNLICLILQYQKGFSAVRSCRKDQSRTLLQLKQEFQPQDLFTPDRCIATGQKSYDKTMFWNESFSNCCQWDGITCDESTGHVIGLDLSCGRLSGTIISNSSLFSLTHLKMLNLAYNSFYGSGISYKFGWLNSLTHLNLSFSGFSGKIPDEFYHLSELVSLDLSTVRSFQPKLDCDVNMLLQNLTKISVLSLNNVNVSTRLPMNKSSSLTYLDLSGTEVYGQIPEGIFENRNLKVLRLERNEGLTGSIPFLNSSTVHSLIELELSYTGISGELPDSIGSLRFLERIGIYHCEFSGSIPESIGNLTELREMYFSNNGFTGHISSTISNLLQLQILDLSYNSLEGQIPDAFSTLQKLTNLYLQSNKLQGYLPCSFTNLSKLIELDLSSNSISGPFPTAGGLRELSVLDLSDNLIDGTISSWILNLPLLRTLDLSSNRLIGDQIGKFEGQWLGSIDLSNNQLNIELASFSNLSKLRYLSLSGNRVMTHAQEYSNVSLHNKLSFLTMSSCGLTEFPDFIRNQSDLDRLDLSKNMIQGPVPSWLSFISEKSLQSLDLSDNLLTHVGKLYWPRLMYLYLSSNSLQGSFPSSICNMTGLSILDLSDNLLSGKIPDCIGNSGYFLSVLDLRRNKFHGTIPITIGEARLLIYLGLNDNHLDGKLPQSLSDCNSLEGLDVGNNMLEDTFPWWLGTLSQLKILILRSNKFYGEISSSIPNESFPKLQIFDISYNYFTGLLPEQFFASLQSLKDDYYTSEQKDAVYMGFSYYEFSVKLSVKGTFVELTEVLTIFTTIDLSSNQFQGQIPESIANLKSLRLLNLSHNNINGTIPPAFGYLMKLEHLDLSWNKLKGGIPWTLTNITTLAFLNLSHNSLVGRIPSANQFLTFSNDSYIGNSGLCGIPLTRDCERNRSSSSPEAFQDKEYPEDLMGGFTWKAVVLGYGCGVVLGFAIGYVMIKI